MVARDKNALTTCTTASLNTILEPTHSLRWLPVLEVCHVAIFSEAPKGFPSRRSSRALVDVHVRD